MDQQAGLCRSGSDIRPAFEPLPVSQPDATNVALRLETVDVVATSGGDKRPVALKMRYRRMHRP
jgi:hypothetical protein